MKKTLLLLSVFTIIGCYSTPRVNYPIPPAIQEIGLGRYTTIAQVNFLKDSQGKLEKMLSGSANSILTSELNEFGFNVLERAEMIDIVKEHAFSKTMGNRKLGSNFYVGEYSVFLNIRNIDINQTNIAIPIVFVTENRDINVDVEIKFVDNTTGLTFTTSGTGQAEVNEWNFLLLVGNRKVKGNEYFEIALKRAIRDALLRIKFYC
jgi:hypothetical protein